MRKIRRTCACLLTLPALLSAPAAAQVWSVDVYAGRATYSDLAPSLGTTNAVLGVRYAGSTGGWLYASAAAPLSAGDPLWAAAGLGRRIAAQIGPASLGVDLAGHGYTFRDPDVGQMGAGGTLIGMPVLSIGSSTARVELRSGVRHYALSYLDTALSRTLHESDARVTLRPAPMLDLGAEVRHARAEEDAYTYAGGTAGFTLGAVEAWASAGRWLHDALPDMSWSAGARLDVGRRFDVWASFQQESTDPLYWNSPRQTWNVGVSRSFGAGIGSRILVSAAVPAGNGVTFSVPVAEAADAPSVAGDFNEWQPVPLRRSGDVWSVTLPVAPGMYHYAFQAADGTWFLPSSVVARIDDGFGGESALLIVE